MDFKYWFIGWKKRQKLYAFGVLIILILFVFVALNVGSSQGNIVNGTITAFGLNTATRYELPAPLITIQLEEGSIITIKGIRGVNHKVGDKVRILQVKRLLSFGYEYSYYGKQ